MQSERQEIDVRGYPVPIGIGGSEPPLLLLHGAGGAGEWSPFYARLAETFTVYAPVQR
jgi:pimeloyl-ACP methyl ester carboxylesterase